MEAYLKATGADRFAKEFNNATKNVDAMERSTGKAGIGIGKLIAAAGGLYVLKKGFDMITSSIDGAISRYDTLNTFPKVLEQIGFAADDSEKAMDRLSEGTKGLPTALDEVAKTTQRIAVLTNDLEGATETTLALNNAFLASGSSSADASRGLEQYVQMLSKGEVDLQSWRTLQETMGVALNDVAKAFGFAGASAQSDLYDALKEGNITFDEFNAKLIELSEGTGGFAERARTASGGIRTAWTNMKTAIVRGVTDVLASIDEMLVSNGLPNMETMINNFGSSFSSLFSDIASSIPKVVQKIKEVKAAIVPWIPAITAAVSAVGGFLVAYSIFNSVKNAVIGLRTSILLMNAALAANPIGLIIGAIAGLIAAFVYLWNTNEGFRQFFVNAWNLIKDTAINVWNSIKTIVMPIVQEIVSFVMSIWTMLVTFWNENGQMILLAAQNVWNSIWNVIQYVMTVVWNVIQTVMNFIWGIMQSIWPSIQGIITTVWNTIKGVISGAINVILGIIQFFSALFTGNWSGMWDAVKRILSGAVNIVKSVISGAFNAIKHIISTIFNAIKSITSTVWNGIKNTISSIVNGIKNTISNIFNSLKGIVSGAFSKVTGAVKDGIGNAYKAVTGKVKDFLNAGKNIVTSIADGIKSKINVVKDAISNVAQKIRDFLPFSPAKEGALRDIMKIQIPQSIAQSIEKGKRTAVQAMANLTNAINGEMPTVDIGGQISGIHGRSQRQMKYEYTNELTISQKQPVNINLHLGLREFRTFVEDITNEQEYIKLSEEKF